MGWSLSQLPVIGLTANFRSAELGMYQGIGMNDCLGKPLRLKDLQITLDYWTHVNTSKEQATLRASMNRTLSSVD
jgi:CheY-like chemotaxis protein